MLYVIGLALAFIFGYLIGREWQKLREDYARPLDLGLTEQELLGPAIGTEMVKQECDVKDAIPDIDWKDLAVFYPHKGGVTGN